MARKLDESSVPKRWRYELLDKNGYEMQWLYT